MERLPDELMHLVLSFVPLSTVASFSSLNHYFYRLTLSDTLWGSLFMTHLGEMPDDTVLGHVMDRSNDDRKTLYRDQQQPANKLCFQLCVNQSWDIPNSEDKLVFSEGEEQKIMSNNLIFGWKGATTKRRFLSGVHYWEIKILEETTRGMMLGVANGTAREVKSGKATAWLFYSYGCKRHKGNPTDYFSAKLSTGQAYGSGYKKNDIVGVYVDIDKGIVGYFVNGQFQGIAFSDDDPDEAFCFPCASRAKQLKQESAKAAVKTEPPTSSSSSVGIEDTTNNLVIDTVTSPLAVVYPYAALCQPTDSLALLLGNSPSNGTSLAQLCDIVNSKHKFMP
eukprot:TRINITY_DN8847_c0_g1_i3.p1 TRINITY_DN8847_c0_g1~~TRINITY_DN8847_c0_g1_i3.p1  ORF type:complete len:343 (-),score=59.12 TRINITY_DN8847_c0_g1_i3:7-1014(-)